MGSNPQILINDPLGTLASLCPSLGFSFLIYTVTGSMVHYGSLFPQHLEYYLA